MIESVLVRKNCSAVSFGHKFNGAIRAGFAGGNRTVYRNGVETIIGNKND